MAAHERSDPVDLAGIGRCPAFLAVVEQARELARIPRPILIRGERGTGKELLARFVHAASPRHAGPYRIVNCGAFQDELLVSHLFGHEKGAFTGATERHVGVFEQANGGTLFLDEVANLSRPAQARLHRVVEYQTFQRVGGTSELEVDVRVIAATNGDLGAMIERGDFMPDLYDRLRFAELVLPPLRQRCEDVPLLIDHFIARLHEELPDLGTARFTGAAVRELAAYSWPGNVRELKNVIERLYVSDRDRTIEASELPLEITTTEPIRGTFAQKVRAFEKALLANALKDADGNQRAAAERLGMTYDQFRHYYRKYALGDLLR
ncbi:MAG TPA: sigma 54-interacting transcriptional regulator [Vicinamibacteria bacterium]|nr:sigma 54-interacting transcriptional regulator [Vicinamibacteria bacterium]